MRKLMVISFVIYEKRITVRERSMGYSGTTLTMAWRRTMPSIW